MGVGRVLEMIIFARLFEVQRYVRVVLSSPQPILVCSKDKFKLLAVVWSAGEVLRSTQCCATLRKVAQLLRNVEQLLRNVTHLTYK